MTECKDYGEVRAVAADMVAQEIIKNPCAILGLPTGGTPVGMYENLCKQYKEGKISFANVTTFNLDEYYPMKRDNDQSYYYFMKDHLYNKVDLKSDHINIPNGDTKDPEAECKRYDQKIESLGGIDLQVLGIGPNGHIGFNEPAESLQASTHKTSLTPSTIAANARFFAKEEDVPKHAITLGIGNIMKAKHILLLVSGKNKHKALMGLLSGEISCHNPSTMLLMHPHVTVLADRAALEG